MSCMSGDECLASPAACLTPPRVIAQSGSRNCAAAEQGKLSHWWYDGGVMRMKRWNIIKERCIFRYGLYILMFCDNRDISEAKLSSNTRPRPIIRSSASLCTGTKYKTAAAADTEFIFYLFNCLCSPSHFKLDIPLIVSCNSADVNFRKVHRNRSKLSVKRSKDESWSRQSFRFCCCCWVSRKIAVGGSLFELKGKSGGHGH